MNTRISRNQAARLIRNAVRQGWKRAVDVTGNGRWFKTVKLENSVRYANGRSAAWSMILVNFVTHVSGRRSVNLGALSDYQEHLEKGPFAANYAIRYIRETRERVEQIEAELKREYANAYEI